jgi:transposase-like protein
MRGRRPKGPEIVRALAGEAQARQRLEVILRTLTGELSFTAAARQLRITTQRLHQLREQALAGSLAALAPQPLGRPSKTAEPGPEQIDDLRRENERLQRELAASKLREEIALVLPSRPRPRPRPEGEKKRGTD